MSAREGYQSRENERLRAEVADLRKENGKLRVELIEARMPVVDGPTGFGFGVIITLNVLAALETLA